MNTYEMEFDFTVEQGEADEDKHFRCEYEYSGASPAPIIRSEGRRMSPDDPAELNIFAISVVSEDGKDWIEVPPGDLWTKIETHLMERLWDELESNTEPPEPEYEYEGPRNKGLPDGGF